MRLSMTSLLSLCLLAPLAAQSTPVAISDLHLVEYGGDVTVRDRLIEAGTFYGDLGERGVARLDALRVATLQTAGVGIAQIGRVLPGEVLLAAVRTRSGAAPLYGRLLLSRRAFFLTAVLPEAVPEGCSGSGFHGGLQVITLDRAYASRRSPPLLAPEMAFDPVIAGLVAQVQQSNLLAHVTALSAIFTRRTTRPENAQAITYVTTQLAALPNLTYRTEVFNSSYGPNVIAEIPGSDLPNEIVMVGAHIDSLVGGSSSARAPGADDNASGSAAVLEIARLFSGQQFRRTLRFGWWNAEELGLYGSQAYANAAAGRGDQIVAYVNIDMNAYRANGDPLSVDYITNDSTASLITLLSQATQTYVPTLGINVGSMSGGTSDHRSFFRAGFPAAFPFEDIGSYSPYIHSSNDVIGTSANDFQLATLITQSVLAGAAEIAEVAFANPGRFDVFGQGCPGTGQIPAGCGSSNSSGGTLAGDTRSYEYCYRVPNTGAAQVTSFELFTQSATGGNVTVGAFVYADAGGSPSATPSATTTMTVGASPGFYRATLSPPVNLNGTFYVGIDHSSQSTVLSNLTAGSPGIGFYRRPPSGSWSQSGLIRYPSFRVACGGGSNNAVPLIGNDGVAIIGRSFAIEVSYAAPNAALALTIGLSDTAWVGGPLPFVIPSTGGCTLFASTEALGQSTSSGAGAGTHSIPVPNDANLIGVEVFHQWIVIDPGANPLGLAVSAAAKTTIGG